MGRAPCCNKVGLKKGPWTPEQDQKLLAYIQEHGHGSWRAFLPKAGNSSSLLKEEGEQEWKGSYGSSITSFSSSLHDEFTMNMEGTWASEFLRPSGSHDDHIVEEGFTNLLLKTNFDDPTLLSEGGGHNHFPLHRRTCQDSFSLLLIYSLYGSLSTHQSQNQLLKSFILLVGGVKRSSEEILRDMNPDEDVRSVATIPSVKELHKAGIGFQPAKLGGISGIEYDEGTCMLSLPSIKLNVN
ncbi:hypothetical protein JHK82_015863 [Glycine max]|nr:hypothetical protein JHK85_016266 [Glycine max]KAG5046484.1 hypothetical protein JHK86_015890 [Glycine max]KAG5148982.1 hypothetical protein JHK82_015863 [Glycine max]